MMKNYRITWLLIFLLIGCNNQNQQTSVQEEETTVENTATSTGTEDGEAKESLDFDFDEAASGQIPEGWTAHLTGEGDKPVWQVVEDKGNMVLAQLSKDNPKCNQIKNGG